MKNVMFLSVLLLGSMSIFASPVAESNAIKPGIGGCSTCSNLLLSKKEAMKMEVMKIYTCSTHNDISSAHAGKCSKCNKRMVAKKMQH